MRYRKKPVEVEARQVPVYIKSVSINHYLEESIALGNWCNGISFMLTADDESAYLGAEVLGPHIEIRTLEGTMAALPGDWIIQGVQGEFYPCKPDIFEATYEPVDEPTDT